MENGGDWGRLGRAVRDRRNRLDLTQEDVTEQGGPSHQTLRNIERGDPGPYQSRTIATLERVLGWRAGIAERIVAGTAPADGDEWLATERTSSYSELVNDGAAPTRLCRILLDAGVGTRWTPAKLERKSRGRVSAGDWQRMLDDVLHWPDQTIRSAADTLRRLGEPVTPERLERAMLADLREVLHNAQRVPDDVLSELKALIPHMTGAEKAVAIQELTQSLVADSSD